MPLVGHLRGVDFADPPNCGGCSASDFNFNAAVCSVCRDGNSPGGGACILGDGVEYDGADDGGGCSVSAAFDGALEGPGFGVAASGYTCDDAATEVVGRVIGQDDLVCGACGRAVAAEDCGGGVGGLAA